jgi:hypothetical protein
MHDRLTSFLVSIACNTTFFELGGGKLHGTNLINGNETAFFKSLLDSYDSNFVKVNKVDIVPAHL